jgi:hypothetical protein
MKTLEEVAMMALERYPDKRELDLRSATFKAAMKRNKERKSAKDKRDGFIEGYLLSQEQDNWISVSERLPEKDVDVMCWSLSDGIVSDSYDSTIKGEHWFRGTRELYRTDVTHWQPLPPKPKQ